VFLNRLNGEPIGFSVLGIFVIDKNTILMVNKTHGKLSVKIVVRINFVVILKFQRVL